VSAPANDLGLAVPLHGLQLIEASAGTGKTFTLATIYARLIIARRLPVPDILAVTFTEAATKELRERLRARLLLALACVDGAGDEHEAAFASEGHERLRRRLRAAAAAMDLAPIHTIHGFCRRTLADHALEAGQPLVERTLIENDTALREEVASDFWRLRARDTATAARLRSLWRSPAGLARSLRGLLAAEVLKPDAVVPDERADAALALARRSLARAFTADGETARDLLSDAIDSGALHGGKVRRATLEKIWQRLGAWSRGDTDAEPAVDDEIKQLMRFGQDGLRDATNKNKATPESPLFDAIDHWAQAQRHRAEVEQSRAIGLVLDATRFARARLALIKRERGLLGYDDMIAGVAEALAGPHGQDFAARLQAQYRVALLDEFQDTDARQWSIFERLFGPPYAGDDRALFLIGDPKQAIYRFRGGDVFTYLAARRRVDAVDRHTLAHNHRSRPAKLAVVEALFTLAGPNAFAQDGIAFTAVAAGGRRRDADLRLDDAVVPALNVLLVDADGNKDAMRDAAAHACVAAIRQLLLDGAAGRLTRRGSGGDTVAVGAGDIAILVERHADGERMQQLLAATGIPSVAAGRRSLYQTDEARHLRWLLAALNDPGDDARLRAALATPLFGLDALTIAAFEHDEAAHRSWQDRLQHWRERAQRQGPLALINDVAALAAPRLLALRDGERRLTNYLQLAEALQDAEAAALGLPGLADALDRRIVDADADNDGELLRLESDAERVKILTLHKSKGLEFELVFLPFAATSGAGGFRSLPPMARFHDEDRRVSFLYPPDGGREATADADETRAEALRLLYVGLTRARLATWVAWGPAKDAEKTAFAWLLHRDPANDRVAKIDADSVRARLAALRAQAAALGFPDAIAVVPAPPPAALAPLAPADLRPHSAPTPPAAIARRTLDRDWWIYSFSQLAREDTGVEDRGASDEVESPSQIAPSRFAGARFGNALHTALELVDVVAWRDWQAALPPEGQLAPLVRALREQGYGSTTDLDEGVPLLTALVTHTLNVRLPEGARLAQLPPGAQRAEMEFHVALAPTAVGDFLALLHAHGLVADRQAFGLRRRLEGLLTGFIDLVYEFDGRYYVLDYKSNQLRDYAPATLAQAVRDSEYDLQYVIYTLALHRWLRFRIGAAYDPARHLGGVRYLFCRGLDMFDADSPGIHAVSLPVELVEALDRLLSRATETSA
jgi:exodeoxyribonuclease V beta subunit